MKCFSKFRTIFGNIYCAAHIHFVWGEFVFTPTAPYIIHNYTAILFPLVSFTNETCGLFLHCFIQKLG